MLKTATFSLPCRYAISTFATTTRTWSRTCEPSVSGRTAREMASLLTMTLTCPTLISFKCQWTRFVVTRGTTNYRRGLVSIRPNWQTWVKMELQKFMNLFFSIECRFSLKYFRHTWWGGGGGGGWQQRESADPVISYIHLPNQRLTTHPALRPSGWYLLSTPTYRIRGTALSQQDLDALIFQNNNTVSETDQGISMDRLNVKGVQTLCIHHINVWQCSVSIARVDVTVQSALLGLHLLLEHIVNERP